MVKPGETWLITGASRGIGLQYVKQVTAPHSLADPNACSQASKLHGVCRSKARTTLIARITRMLH